MPAPLNFTNFHADLMKTYDGNGQILMDAVWKGVESLKNDFTVVTTRDKKPLVGLDVKDGWKPAKDTFDPSEVLAVRSRIVSFRSADIDIEIKRSDIETAYKTYLGWIKTPGRTLKEVQNNPFELYFIDYVIAKHFEFIRLKTAWKGVYNAAGSGAGVIADGLITKTTAGRGVGGDIKAAHVFEGAAITDATAYAQVNGVTALVASVRPELLNEPLNIYFSQASYDKYRKNRRALFPEHVGPADRPTVSDDYSNMSFVIDPGLAGKDTIVVSPKKNLLFVGNEDPGAYLLSIDKRVKSWEMNIRVSCDFDYASPDWLFLNDRV